MPRYLADAQERGSKRVYIECDSAVFTSGAAYLWRRPRWLRLMDMGTGDIRTLYACDDNEYVLNPVFVDDDTIFYQDPSGYTRLTLSTGRTEILYHH
jgi:hypothetical protein